MRLDKYLKVSRLIKRRTIASQACDSGRVYVNGIVAKASRDVKLGDEISIVLSGKTLTVTVVSLREHIGKAEAPLLYDEVRR